MKGLLFTPEMARAVMREIDPKTNTRRIINPQPNDVGFGRNCQVHPYCTGVPWPVAYYERRGTCWNSSDPLKPAYKVGERVCLLTTWAVHHLMNGEKPTELGDCIGGFWHAGMGDKPGWCGKSRPGRFLPNHLRPLMPMLEITEVRVQRVQDISEADALAEGAEPVACGENSVYFKERHRLGFMSLWDSINAKRGFGWAQNPWVWAYTFRRVTS